MKDVEMQKEKNVLLVVAYDPAFSILKKCNANVMP